MTLRIATAIGLGLITTFGLFWVMQALVGTSGELKEGRTAPRVEFVRLKRDRSPETKKREPPKREKPEQPPPPPQMNMAKAMNPSEAVGEIVPMVDTGVELEKATSLGSGRQRSRRRPAGPSRSRLSPPCKAARDRGIRRPRVHDRPGGHGRGSPGDRGPPTLRLRPGRTARRTPLEIQPQGRGRDCGVAVRHQGAPALRAGRPAVMA